MSDRPKLRLRPMGPPALPAALALLAALSMTAGCASGPRGGAKVNSPPDPTDGREAVGGVVYVAATVLTFDPELPVARAVRVEGDRITDVWAEPPGDAQREAHPADRVVDLGDATVLPGLVDAHLHLRGVGAAARMLDLRGTGSAEQIVAMVAKAAADAPAGAWVRGRGWDQNDWEATAFPDAATLDPATADHPVWLTRIDGHAVWINSRALELAGLTEQTPDPEGGELLRDEEGRPTGVLVDNAIDLVSGLLPAPSAAELRADYERGIALCGRVGLTGVHDMGVDPDELAALRAIEADGTLTLRTTAYLAGGADGLEPILAAGPDHDGLLRIAGVKLFADGALGSRGAALLEPYSDRPETSGLLVTDPAELASRARDIHDKGWQLAIHAIGDRGNRIALDAIEAAQGDDRGRRHRIEHAQIVDLADIPRFAALQVVASMQPTHATSDMPWAPDRLGPDRLDGAYAWRRMLDAGAPLAFGSDAPIEGESPWLGVYAAVTRQDADGLPEGGWLADQRLSVEEALAGFAAGAAFAGHQDGDLGVLRAGALADLTVVDRDPRTTPPSELESVRTLRTVVGGVEAFAAVAEIR